jgi:hypothetical protein
MSFEPGQLESALARLEALTDASARAAAREAVTAVLELHREGIERFSRRLREAGPEGERIFHAAAEDQVIASLLLLHGFHPRPLETRVRDALDKVRVAEGGYGPNGHIEVLSIEEAAIRLRCSGSKAFRRAVEQAVEAAAPEVERVEMLELASDLVPLERLLAKRELGHERCDLCGESLGHEHSHLFDVERRSLACACVACSVLFQGPRAKIRRVPRKALCLEGLVIGDAQWEALEVPVRLAFFSRSSALGNVIAAYPGPAGAVESVVPPAAWEDVVKDNAALAELEADISALLVDRRGTNARYYLLSIDECYRLTGLVRSRWQGLSGGDAATRAVAEFFEGLVEAPP